MGLVQDSQESEQDWRANQRDCENEQKTQQILESGGAPYGDAGANHEALKRQKVM